MKEAIAAWMNAFPNRDPERAEEVRRKYLH